MLQLKYQIHLILQSKYKFLFNIILYFIIMLIYTLYLNNILTECMMHSSAGSSTAPEVDITNRLMQENNVLRDMTQQDLADYTTDVESGSVDAN